MTAAEELTRALLDLADGGQRPPCAGRHEWTSDDADDRAAAAQLCSGCPIVAACEAAADEADERHHVWAGTDRTRKPGRPKKESEA